MATIVDKIYEAAHAHPREKAVEVIEAMLEAWSDAVFDSLTETPTGYTMSPDKFKSSLREKLARII